MDNPIIEFLNARKAMREKNPGNRTSEEIEREFAPQNWIASAAKRASQLTLVSHPGKYTHPDANISAIQVTGDRCSDGLLRTGNVADVPTDVFGNAAALDVFAFLSILLDDGNTVLEHFRADSTALKAMLGFSNDSFQSVRTGFLQIDKNAQSERTDGRVKQVYFPISESSFEYHLLSILTPSGIVFQQRERIRFSKFSEQTKSVREAVKAGLFSESGFLEFPNLLTIHFGGSQPQNVSRLNSSNSGEAYLMPCLPPAFSSNYTKLPSKDFFRELRWDDTLKSLMKSLHRIFVTDFNNTNIRDARRFWFTQIFEWVLERAVPFQTLAPGWSHAESVRIPTAQKWWLDTESYDEDPDIAEYRTEIIQSIVRWILYAYGRLYSQKEFVNIGLTEELRFRKELEMYLQENEDSIL
jgi:CRISPR-associated protein Csy1